LSVVCGCFVPVSCCNFEIGVVGGRGRHVLISSVVWANGLFLDDVRVEGDVVGDDDRKDKSRLPDTYSGENCQPLRSIPTKSGLW
jgi:hypothetical protein